MIIINRLWIFMQIQIFMNIIKNIEVNSII